jgi:HK97 gp10 family phage protein
VASFAEPPWPVIIARIQEHLSKLDRVVNKAVDDALEKMGTDAEGLIRASLMIPYPPPSAPGSPPHRRTGKLSGSYKHEVSGGGGTHVLKVGSGVFYAPYLEFGTRYMAPRPHLKPGFTVATVNLRAKIVRAIAEAEARYL